MEHQANCQKAACGQYPGRRLIYFNERTCEQAKPAVDTPHVLGRRLGRMRNTCGAVLVRRAIRDMRRWNLIDC